MQPHNHSQTQETGAVGPVSAETRSSGSLTSNPSSPSPSLDNMLEYEPPQYYQWEEDQEDMIIDMNESSEFKPVMLKQFLAYTDMVEQFELKL